MTGTNADQRAYWNRDEARHWVEQQRRYDEMLEPFGRAVLRAAAIGGADHVLDIGCGNGATTRAAARAAVSGAALGIDLSEAMVERARETAAVEGVENVEFEKADAQTRAFAPDFDCALSRFGVMFFDDPVAAFTNIRRGLRDEGRAVFAVWQEMLANEWMAVPATAVLAHVALPDPGGPGGPDAPGPFALADPSRVRSILLDAGFTEVSVEPFESPMLLGGRGTLDEATTFLRNTGMAHALLDHAPPEAQARAVAAVRDALAPYATPDGVRLSAAAWLVRAVSRR